MPPKHADRWLFLSNLAAALAAGFDRTGRVADLDEAITSRL